jgi:DNA-binding NarL/FixJ family response regulator
MSPLSELERTHSTSRADATHTSAARPARLAAARVAIECSPVESLPAGLSAREIGVLRLVAAGWRNEEVGRSLFISEETVKTHVRHLLHKLQARNRAHAVAIGIELGLISAAAAD